MATTVLEEIVQQRRKRLAESAFQIPECQPSERSMFDSIKQSDTGIIFECKAKSPSRGVLSDNYQPALIATNYAQFASGISILTEPDYFAGSYEHLESVRAAVDTPLLCKDFVVDEQQIYLARSKGADCILLMLSVISDAFWKTSQQLADELGLDTITEVHNHQELQRAIQLGAKIIGINNRDLHSLTTNLDVTRELAPLVPKDRLLISESGIGSYQDLRSLAPLVDGFLIGTSMMQSASLEQALRRLIYSEVKVCGLTNAEDAKLAYDCGASWGGLIFTEQSPRFVQAAEIKSWVSELRMPMVGVFMDQTIEQVCSTAEQLSLAAIQLHGIESPEYVSELKICLADGIQIWKAISASDTDDNYPSAGQLETLVEEWKSVGVNKVLVDKPKQGSGHDLDLNHVAGMKDVMLAGGLDADSDLVLSEQRLAGIDICSALEQSKGIKDPQKVVHFFNTIRVKTRHE